MASSEQHFFGEFRLSVEPPALYQGQEAIALGGSAMKVLLALAEAHGDLVPARTLSDRFWPQDTDVMTNVHHAIRELRTKLGDEVIRTVGKSGYQLALEFRAQSPEPLATPTEVWTGTDSRRVANELLSVVARFVRGANNASDREREILEAVLEPAFNDLRRIHINYLRVFSDIQKDLPTSMLKSDPAYAEQVNEAVRRLKDLRVEFAPVRVEIRILATQLRQRALSPAARRFTEALLDYFPNGELRVRSPPRNPDRQETEATMVIGRISHELTADSSPSASELLAGTVIRLESAWAAACEAYQTLELDIRLGRK
jgi:DNA-binding winged helix-turn-helix (wHTH) protein